MHAARDRGGGGGGGEAADRVRWLARSIGEPAAAQQGRLHGAPLPLVCQGLRTALRLACLNHTYRARRAFRVHAHVLHLAAATTGHSARSWHAGHLFVHGLPFFLSGLAALAGAALLWVRVRIMMSNEQAPQSRSMCGLMPAQWCQRSRSTARQRCAALRVLTWAAWPVQGAHSARGVGRQNVHVVEAAAAGVRCSSCYYRHTKECMHASPHAHDNLACMHGIALTGQGQLAWHEGPDQGAASMAMCVGMM